MKFYDNRRKSIKNFKQGLNCSQSVIEAYSHTSGLGPETAKAVSAGFGGSMGRTQKTFEKIHGSSDCISLMGVDLNTDEEKKKFRERNLSDKKSLKYVQDACDILEEDL